MMALAAAYAARERLRSSPRACDRSQAAFELLHVARTKTAFARALCDATYDEKPLVRHAAASALAGIPCEDGPRLLARLAGADPIWWVRRAALGSLARVQGAWAGNHDPLDVVVAALDDPFWRVRHAAVRSLREWAEHDAGMRLRVLDATSELRSPRARGAVEYLRRRLGMPPDAREEFAPEEVVVDGPAPRDPDPAVVTSRLQDGAPAGAFLVECLGDPHAPLRRIARRRLRDVPDLRLLSLALLWLEEPRIPRVAMTVLRLLDELDPTSFREVHRHALEGGPPHATAWAVSRVDTEDVEPLLPLVASEYPLVRAAVASALARHALRDASALAALSTLALDPVEEVARVAAMSLLELGPEASVKGLRPPASHFAEHPVLVRRVLVVAAADAGWDDVLRCAERDADDMTRSIGIAALFAKGGLSQEALARYRADPDPDIRRAVFSGARWEEVLRSDPSREMRRQAFRTSLEKGLAARIAAEDPDPWLRVQSARTLARGPGELVALVALAADPIRAVRTAARDALLACPELDNELERLLGEPVAEPLLQTSSQTSWRTSAYALLLRRLDEAALDRARRAVAEETGDTRAFLAEIVDGLGGNVSAIRRSATERGALSSPAATTRSLAGLSVSPLAISGVHGLACADYERAVDAGCNVFFWEPRYTELGRFLRRRREGIHVVSGTYHHHPDAIEADLRRARRRTGRDVLDVFLLFWTRSEERVTGASLRTLERLRKAGSIRAIGVSTHDRALALLAIDSGFDVIMIRHNAIHPGAEEAVLPAATAKGVGVLLFSALSYGRLIRAGVAPLDAYRYSAHQPGCSAVVSAPRSRAELEANLALLSSDPLPEARLAELRALGRELHQESRDFAKLIRRFPDTPKELYPRTRPEDRRKASLSSAMLRRG